MNPEMSNFEYQLHDLRTAYLGKLPQHFSELELLYNNLMLAKKSELAYAELKRKVHSLIGSSGMYDFKDLSQKLRDFNKLLSSVDPVGEHLNPQFAERLRSHLIAIKSLVQRLSSGAAENSNSESKNVEVLAMPSVNILIATDDDLASEKLRLDLSYNKHQLYFAKNGQQAVELFLQNAIDIVILDISLPIMDGYQTVYKIKSIRSNAFVPALFITSIEIEQELVQCFIHGGDDILSKSYSPGILNAKVYSLTRMSNLINNQA